MPVAGGVRLGNLQRRGIGRLVHGDGRALTAVRVEEVGGALPGLVGLDDGGGLLVGPDSLLVALAAGEEPALPEEPVVGPVRGGGAEGHRPAAHGHGVDQEHHRSKDRQRQNPVGDNPVDPVRDTQPPGLLPPAAAVHDGGDPAVALRGDNGLGAVVHLMLAGGDVPLQTGHVRLAEAQLSDGLRVPLENFDGVPPLPLLGNALEGVLPDMGQGVLHTAAEGVPEGGSAAGGGHGQIRRLGHTGVLQGGDGAHSAPQLSAQGVSVNPVAAALHHIHHVDGHHHRDAHLRQLGGQIEIPLQVGAVYNIQYHIRPLIHQIVPCNNLLQGVGRQGVDPRQVHNDHIRMPLQTALLLLHRYAGPVPHKLAGTGEGVKQRGLPAVGIPRQCNPYHHDLPPYSVIFYVWFGKQQKLAFANPLSQKTGLPARSAQSTSIISASALRRLSS